MIPGVDLITVIKTASLLGVGLIIFAESGLPIGFFLPGDSILFTTGFLISQNVLSFNIHIAVLIVFIAAVAGVSVGYAFGKSLGPRLFSRPNARFFKQENVHRAQLFYEKYGGKAIVLARFIPVIRTFAPIVAGIGNMNYKKFLFYNIIGALLWAVCVTYLGYFAGHWFASMGWTNIDQFLLPFIIIIVVVSVLPAAIHILRDKKMRTTLWNSTVGEIRSFFIRKR
jgi:membrane-associated protein